MARSTGATSAIAPSGVEPALTMMMNLAAVRAYLLGLQDSIVGAFETEGGEPFMRDAWTRQSTDRLQGDGCSRLIEDGRLLERGGCNFSHVRGTSLPPSATQHRPELAGAPFEAIGVSLVMHPRNPFVPTVHMNVRVFAALPEGREAVVWFGGGMDLTPYYGFEGRRGPLPPHQPRRARAVRRRQVRALQAVVRRLLLPQAPPRAARHRRRVLRRLHRARIRRRLRDAARGRRCLHRRLPPDRAAPSRVALWRDRTRLPGLSARPLCRVQPRLRSRHAVRPAIGRGAPRAS